MIFGEKKTNALCTMYIQCTIHALIKEINAVRLLNDYILTKNYKLLAMLAVSINGTEFPLLTNSYILKYILLTSHSLH